MMNVYQSQAKTKSFNNRDMPAKDVLKRRVGLASNDSYEKFYLAVKGLRCMNINYRPIALIMKSIIVLTYNILILI